MVVVRSLSIGIFGAGRMPTPQEDSVFFWGGFKAQPLLPTRRFSLCGTGILPVLQKYSKYWMKTEQGHF
ncbi:MAG: hypothetical protein EAZ90_05545 [Oscillatoriales cyanobacterium]|nr:MAG: hypothetical protein EAZ94_01695 [Oscillatoriales cyanobacterium]TAE28050.1 MAG: hypothetical protein EAZ93_04700 [Oscillatoriales cyanobacterium]TAE44645.1 MAG: hypothetical protein EAZ90_05545 [Oscillatoriales cyanobacterium]TAG96270.1 MAG: hypothetical protein EAZ19_09480 [Oscillatoriales cyanobacterium]